MTIRVVPSFKGSEAGLLVKLIKIGAKLVEHGRYLTFQMAEVSISREIFAEILSRIKQLRCCEA